MSKKIDILNQKFGNRKVVREGGRNSRGQILWLVECSCGRKDWATCTAIKKTKYCRDCQMTIFKKHGDYNERLYKIHKGMLQRCNNKNARAYKWYGGLGITVCKEWLDYKNFKAWSLANNYKPNLTIDRVDNNKGYNPDNCRWVTIQEQNKAGRKRIKKENTSGVTGVYYRKDIDKWFAGVGINGKFIRSGCFNTKKEAVSERQRLLKTIRCHS